MWADDRPMCDGQCRVCDADCGTRREPEELPFSDPPLPAVLEEDEEGGEETHG